MSQESIGTPGPVLPARTDVAYTVDAWDEECFTLFAEGRDPSPCPSCGRTGFYGPRVADAGLRVRACRFCGFYQEVDGPPGRAQATAHRCATWPEVAKAAYVWWVPPGREAFHCPFCDEAVPVADHGAKPPSDDPAHPWWKVPQNRNRFYYSRFWENWPFTKGRVFL